MQVTIHPKFQNYQTELSNLLDDFDQSGTIFIDGKRNKIKLFQLDGKTINVKSFKVPNLINKFAYKFIRKSKARRSYEFANRLLECGIGTPQPIAFSESFSWIGIKTSFYISEHLKADLTYRELVEIPTYPDHENILRQFVQFSFQLHENGIEFLDHSPGNTLIKKVGEGKYEFYLVDLNRMNFQTEMNLNSRMKNLSRLTSKMEMVAIMSDEYSKLFPESYDKIYSLLKFHTEKFQGKYQRKQKMKKRFKFWK